ncbi:hypothetical protein [Psittacicella gerlachiana]|uniref:Uncharacterized protein n=1 Tax=Psittacicella gerlachiana TaxID=2028574 RepID=A0A3A1YIM0_9GAMM|nr:hypothetical protein [Psittacicella gerlachiana]RIY37515.1 hypothetical protein CKF59_01565 [Psittacicella gerlachiana]
MTSITHNLTLWQELYQQVSFHTPQIKQAISLFDLQAPTLGVTNFELWHQLGELIRNQFYQPLTPKIYANEREQYFQAIHSSSSVISRNYSWQNFALYLCDLLLRKQIQPQANTYTALTLWRQSFPFLRPQVNLFPQILEHNQGYKLSRSLILCTYLAPYLSQLIENPTKYNLLDLHPLVGSIDFTLAYYPEPEAREVAWLLASCLPTRIKQELQVSSQGTFAEFATNKELAQVTLLQQILKLASNSSQIMSISFAQQTWKLSLEELESVQTQVQANLQAYFLEAKPLGVIETSTEFFYSRYQHQGVLTPRPATEVVVEQAIEQGQELIFAQIKTLLEQKTTFNLVDLGAGSGCLGASVLQGLLLKFAPTPLTFKLQSCDLSEQALKVCQTNLEQVLGQKEVTPEQKHNDQFLSYLERHPQLKAKFSFEVKQSDWLSAVKAPIHLLLANPPYIEVNDPLLVYSQDDPWLALVACEQGLEPYAQILSQASSLLAPQALIIMEHGHEQQATLLALTQKINAQLTHGQYLLKTCFKDYNDQPRGTIWQWLPA